MDFSYLKGLVTLRSEMARNDLIVEFLAQLKAEMPNLLARLAKGELTVSDGILLGYLKA